MDPAHKTVTRLPLGELWRDNGFRTTSRGRSRAEDDIASLLRVGRVQFVVVDLGAAPFWIPLDDCYRFCKEEAKPHLGESRARLDDFPNGYYYFASHWSGGAQAAPIVVLEKNHRSG